MPSEPVPSPTDVKGSRDELPSAATLTKVAKHTVLDREGKELRFEDLYAGPNASQRTLVVFVRHFYCGSCQEYLRSMVEVITPDYLSHLPVTTSVAIIGCGSPSLIDHYAAEVGGCPYPLYCDPTLKLYDDLGMYTTWDLGPHPAYIRKSMVRVVLESFWQIFRLLPAGLALSGGPKSQVGGEFLFELSGDGEEKRISWCHRMNTSRDHTEIPIIADILDGGSTHDEPKAVTQ